MGRVKTGLLAVTVATVGVITLRKFRKRLSKATTDDETVGDVAKAKDELEETKEDVEDAAEDVEDAKGEAITAVKHAGSAVKHAGFAAGKALKRAEKSPRV